MAASPAAGGRRPYRSPRRRQQAAETRAAVLAAATALFADRGWSATGMRDVATQAGVAVETVYSGFGSKTDLLVAAIDAGVVGDADPEPLAQRPEFAALARGPVADRVSAAARLVAGINHRSWRLQRALAEAAVGEPQLAAKLHELEHGRRDNLRQAIEMVSGRPVDDDVLDASWVLLGGDAFELLTAIGGRSLDSYESWVGSTLRRLIVEGD